MNFGNISEDILDLPSLRTSEGFNSLRFEIESLRLDENIIHASWMFNNKNEYSTELNTFTAWTETYVIFLTRGVVDDQYLSYVYRHPQEKF